MNNLIAMIALDLGIVVGALQFKNAWMEQKLDLLTLLALEVVGSLESALLVHNSLIAGVALLEILIVSGAKQVTMEWEDVEILDSLVALTLDRAHVIYMEVALSAQMMLLANGVEMIWVVWSLTLPQRLEDGMELNLFITTLLLAHALQIEIVQIAKLQMDAVGVKTLLA